MLKEGQVRIPAGCAISGVISKYPGKRRVYILLSRNGKRLAANSTVSPCSRFFAEIQSIIGKER